jgi:hypothetical protein
MAIPKELLEDVGLDLVAQDRCTQTMNFGRRFCGKQAVAYQVRGPRCDKHLKEGEAADYLSLPEGLSCGDGTLKTTST